MSFKMLKPYLDPWVGCLFCGCGEMVENKNEIICSMRTRLDSGWRITKNGKVIYEIYTEPKNHKDLITLQKIENMARKDPDNDWRAIYLGYLRGAEYQRQGPNKWVLVSSNRGMA